MQREAGTRARRLTAVCDHAASSGRGGAVSEDGLPPAAMAALREAVLGFYEESFGRLVAQQRRGRPPRRLHPLTLVVLLPWLLLVGVVRMAVTRREPQVEVCQQQAVSLYRQLSGKDPVMARAELGRISQQLMAIDQRGKPSSARWQRQLRPTGRSLRPRPARCWPTTWVAGRPMMCCWPRSRLPGWSTRPWGAAQRTGRWGGLPGVWRRRRRSSPVRGGRRWTATSRGGVPGLSGAPSRTARRTMMTNQSVRPGGWSR